MASRCPKSTAKCSGDPNSETEAAGSAAGSDSMSRRRSALPSAAARNTSFGKTNSIGAAAAARSEGRVPGVIGGPGVCNYCTPAPTAPGSSSVSLAAAAAVGSGRRDPRRLDDGGEKKKKGFPQRKNWPETTQVTIL